MTELVLTSDQTAAKEALITTQMQTASDVLRHENAVKKLTDKYNSLIKNCYIIL